MCQNPELDAFQGAYQVGDIPARAYLESCGRCYGVGVHRHCDGLDLPRYSPGQETLQKFNDGLRGRNRRDYMKIGAH